jgi:hypothetical protein
VTTPPTDLPATVTVMAHSSRASTANKLVRSLGISPNRSFRMSKTDLAARPMFHHTREAIEAHLTVVFAALVVARYLQNSTGLSIKKIIQTLRPLQHITICIAGHEHIAADPLTPTAHTILEALKITPH